MLSGTAVLLKPHYDDITAVYTHQFIRYRPRKWITPADSESHGSGLLYKAGREALRHSVTVRLNVRMGKRVT